ncbi:hypothetical protein HRI_000726500 [Hibiscus trionum]|uniref:RNase H type-1 domain-containing protein n=1 Tax=Hibiscus trionum TaxID=183268 RepID=A0A9W7H4M8_HIBTR|nr:hypothetical protein HRI_000726500 [Hibiscus trionum]
MLIHGTSNTRPIGVERQLMHEQPRLEGWTRPPEGWSKLNTDGAVSGGSGMTSCGGVIRGAEGQWIMGFTRRLRVCSPLEAKLFWDL